MMSINDVKTFLQGPSHEWKWEHIEGQVYRSYITVNSLDYEVYAKLIVKETQYEYEIIEINIINQNLH